MLRALRVLPEKWRDELACALAEGSENPDEAAAGEAWSALLLFFEAYPLPTTIDAQAEELR